MRRVCAYGGVSCNCLSFWNLYWTGNIDCIVLLPGVYKNLKYNIQYKETFMSGEPHRDDDFWERVWNLGDPIGCCGGCFCSSQFESKYIDIYEM